MVDRTANVEPIQTCFIDQSYSTPIDMATFQISKCVCLTCDDGTIPDGKIYRLAASLAPIVPNSNLALFMTTNREMVFLMQTDAAHHKDGPSRSMYGDALRAIGLEDRDEREAWQPSSTPLTTTS
jgi:hypothetical protein